MRFQILRQSITKTESVLATAASPPLIGFCDFDARILWEILSLPELGHTIDEIFHEFLFYLAHLSI